MNEIPRILVVPLRWCSCWSSGCPDLERRDLKYDPKFGGGCSYGRTTYVINCVLLLTYGRMVVGSASRLEGGQLEYPR